MKRNLNKLFFLLFIFFSIASLAKDEILFSVNNKPVDKCLSSDFNFDVSSGYTIEEIYLPKKSKETHIVEGSVDEIVEELTGILKNKIKVG